MPSAAWSTLTGLVDSTRLDATRLDSTRLDSTRRDSTRRDLPCAELQVNLSSSQAATAIAAVDEAEKAGTPPPPDLFDASQDEIFHLMERDTYPRFKSDPSQVSKLADQFFSQVDADGSNSVSYSEYRKWAMSEPIVIVFFRGLVDVGNHIMKAMDIEHQGVQEEHAPAPTTEADAKI